MSTDLQTAGTAVGRSESRVDGPLKVTGAARYSGDVQLPRMSYAVIVRSQIAHGSIAKLDTAKAQAVHGVLKIISHLNSVKLRTAAISGGQSQAGEAALMPLQSPEIHYNGQPIALVVATTYEAAREAAGLVSANYHEAKAALQFTDAHAIRELPEKNHGKALQMQRGQVEQGFAQATVVIDQTYETPVEHHNPMEPSASVASWNGDQLTIYDATQGMKSQQKALAEIFSLQPEQVHVISHFVGGGFGCKGATWPHSIMAAMAAKVVQRPVQLILSRADMFFAVGHRTRTVQRIALGATSDGKLTAIRHHAKVHTSPDSTFVESCVFPTKMLYHCEHIETATELHRLHLQSPTYMRAPGETPGVYALEVAMDELAYKLNMNPLQLRLINHAETNLEEQKPFSSKHLKECYAKGADLFGWQRWTPQPRSLTKGRLLSGLGMATALYPANRSPAEAKATMLQSGDVVVVSATHDMGQGTYTIMTQIAADVLGLPVSRVHFELGDSSLPKAPVSGGSQTAASVGPAVAAAARALLSQLVGLATQDAQSPLAKAPAEAIEAVGGRLRLRHDQSQGDTYVQILQRAKRSSIAAEGKAEKKSDDGRMVKPECKDDDPACHSFYSFGAQFAEVVVDPVTREIRVERMVGVFDAGRILNPKLAASQGYGGMTMGLGMALMEETVIDQASGRFITHNLADYHVPVHADVRNVEVHYLDYPDLLFNPLGARGIGEISITGAAAAIANAVFHATGVRVRQLPITLDKLV